MAKRIVTESELRFKTDSRELDRALRLLREMDALEAKVKATAGAGNDRATASLRRMIGQQELANRIVREHGVSTQVAARAVRAFGTDLDRADREAAGYALELQRTGDETRRLAAAQRAASSSGRGHLVTVQNLHRAYAALAGVVGVGVLARGIERSVEAFEHQARVSAQVEARIRSTGNVIGITSKEIHDFAGEWQRATGIADEQTEQLAASLLPFTGVVRESFDRVLKSAFNVAEVMQTDVKSALLVVAKAAEQPERAQSILRRSGVSLSETEAELARMYTATGEAAKAQDVVLSALEKRYGGAAEAARKAGGSIAALKTELGDFSEVVGAAFMKGGGRDVIEWATAFVRSSREIIAAGSSEAKSFREVEKRAQTLGEFYTLLSFAAQSAAGEVHPLTTYLRNNAVASFEAAKGAAKYKEELMATLGVTQRFESQADDRKEKRLQKRLDAGGTVIAQMEAEAQAAKDLERFIRSLDTSSDKLNAELEEAERRFHKGEIGADLYAKAIKRAAGAAEGLANVKFDPFAQMDQEVGPPVPESVAAALRRVAAQEIADAARALELRKEIADTDVAILRKREEIEELYRKGNLTLDERNELLEKNRATVEVTGEEVGNLVGAWDEVMDAAIRAAHNGQEAWAGTLLFIADNMDSLIQGFSMLGDALTKAGRSDLGSLANGISQLASGQIGAGIGSVAGGLGLTEGNFLAEGAAIGEQFGGMWGAIIGAAVGAFVKKGKDDLHSFLEEVDGRAQIVITQAEGDLAEAAQQAQAILEGFFNTLQGGILADLDFAAAGLEFHGRGGDRWRVVVNGVERIFDSIDEALAFATQGVLAANATAAGLGESMRALFEHLAGSAVVGSMDRLQAALDLAARLDFAETGVDERALAAFREDLKLAAEYGIPLEKVVALRQKELAALREDVAVRARGLLGGADWAGPILDLTRGMEVFNATTAKQAELDRARIEELQRLIAAQEETLVSTDGLAIGLQGGLGVQGRFRDGIARDGEALDSYTGGIDDATRSHLDGRRQLELYREELDALTGSLADGVQTFTEEDMGRLWEKALADAGMALLDMIEAVEGPAATVEERRRLQNTLFMLQLGAQIQAAEALLATMQFVSEESRLLFEGLVGDARQLLDDLVSGRKTLDLGAGQGGGGRRQQRLEEERRAQEEAARAAEEAAKRLDDFVSQLRTFEANARTASGTLGELAGRLEDIAAAARQAAEDGATELEARRFQQLALRQERNKLLEPFRGTRREDFAAGSAEIERQRRDAVEQARLIAQAQADALGVSFEVMFAGMVAEIDNGARRMQNELGRAVVDALNLPLEGTRREMQAFRKALADLDQLYAKGQISTRRYLDLQAQVVAQQTAAVGSQALSLLDKYYTEVEGREELRQSWERANFELELASLQLRFNMLLAENVLAQDVADRIDGLITFMEKNPPDWERFFAPPEGGISLGGSSASPSSAVRADFSNLADAIRDFVHGFNQIDVGRFTAQARDWLKAIDDFNRDISQMLAEGGPALNSIKTVARQLFGAGVDITQLNAEQLAQVLAGISQSNIYYDDILRIIDALSAASELDDVLAGGPGKILEMYEGTLEDTNALARRYAEINNEFSDVVQAMTELGASADEIARAEAVHQERLLQFWTEALAGFKSLSDEIRGGSFGGVNTRTAIEDSQARIDELRARVAADPLDFQALQELEAELRNQIALQKEFSGGVVGPEFKRLLEEVLGISDQIQQQVVPPEIQAAIADPAVLQKMDEQTEIFVEIRDGFAMQEERFRRNDSLMNDLLARNAAALSALARPGFQITAQA